MKMVDKEGKIRLFRLLMPPPGWKCPKRFKLGLEEPWQSEYSSNSETDQKVTHVYVEDDEIDDIILLVSQNSWEIDCSSDSETDEARVYYKDDGVDDDILLLASQQFEEEYEQV